MSDFVSGYSVNCILLDVNLYETKGESNNTTRLREDMSKMRVMRQKNSNCNT